MICKSVVSGLIFFLAINYQLLAQSHPASAVKAVGAMKNVMWQGKLYGTINLDTITAKTHLYGLGPVEYLSGEILILDSVSYKSTIVNDSSVVVEQTFQVKAPFFVYANVGKWKEQTLPDTIQNLKQLEAYLDAITKNATRPFAFRLTGIVTSASIHVVNLPKGKEVRNPNDAHTGQKSYNLPEKAVEILGFFSTEHQAIFTHHDTYLHLHLITADKTMMGHLDEVTFKKGAIKLSLPEE